MEFNFLSKKVSFRIHVAKVVNIGTPVIKIAGRTGDDHHLCAEMQEWFQSHDTNINALFHFIIA